MLTLEYTDDIAVPKPVLVLAITRYYTAWPVGREVRVNSWLQRGQIRGRSG